MICTIEGKKMSMKSFIKLIGIESRAHGVKDKDINIFLTSSWEVGCKIVSRVANMQIVHGSGYYWDSLGSS